MGVWTFAKRWGRVVLGFVLLAAGVSMLVLPGPGWASIIAGLALLATEFAWAQRLLQTVKETAVTLRDRVNRSRRP